MGLELLERLGADAAYGSVKVVMLLAVAIADDVAASLQRGAVDYLTKPIDLDRFLGCVAFHLRGTAA